MEQLTPKWAGLYRRLRTECSPLWCFVAFMAAIVLVVAIILGLRHM
jgi:hypothetical protein